MDNNKTSRKKPPLAIIAIIAFFFIAIITTVILLLYQGTVEDDVVTAPNFHSEKLTEAEKQITAKVMDEYADVTVDGYKEFEDELGVHKAIVVNVKNISNEKISLAINIIAKDSEGNVLDRSSLYAEGILPGQTQTFNTFVYSELTPDELKSAKYEVFKAYTYETPTSNSDSNPNTETPVEESVETTETNTSETTTPEEESSQPEESIDYEEPEDYEDYEEYEEPEEYE